MTAQPTTPVTALVQSVLVNAHLEILAPSVPVPFIPVRFNPTQYVIEKGNTFAEIPIPGLGAPPLQYIRGNAARLTTELLLDTSDTLIDVRLAYTDQLRSLLDINAELHAPPIVRFVWGGEVFVGVVETMNFTYQLFTPGGIPLRAQLNLTLKEYTTVEQQIAAHPTNSPDVDKAYTVRRGDTLSAIAGTVYNDPTQWRAIAKANAITDPRSLTPGLVLSIPPLT